MKRSTYRFGAVATVAVIAAALFVGRGPSAQSTPLPFTFYLTHYELLGDMNNPSGVRYHSNGAPFAKARDGSSIAFTGQGAWDPASGRVTGTGGYVIKNRSGAVRAQGTWRVTRSSPSCSSRAGGGSRTSRRKAGRARPDRPPSRASSSCGSR
jgi:hypothetical protein